MMTEEIVCPKCHQSFVLEEAVLGQLNQRLEKRYQTEFEQKISKKEQELRKEAEQKIGKREQELQKETEQLSQEKFGRKLQVLEKENQKVKSENKILQQKEISILEQEAALKEKAEDLQLQARKQILQARVEIENTVKQKEQEKSELRERELVKQLADQKKLVDEMKRKAEQGSVQLQGEVQELAIYEMLTAAYPMDTIEKVGKGIKGADTCQTVRNAAQQACGSILYEIKRTKNFSEQWIEKLKQDQQASHADIAVLVTQALPKDMNSFGERAGIWVCAPSELPSLSFVLRKSLLQVNAVRTAHKNKGDKKELMYNYLMSNEFKQSIVRMVETFTESKKQLDKEKLAMQKQWSMREKQIVIIQETMASMFGSIKGIAGNELEDAGVLELPGWEKEQQTL